MTHFRRSGLWEFKSGSGSDITEARIDDMSDAEVDVLLEIYEVLRLTPGNGRILRQAGTIPVDEGRSPARTL